MGTVFSTTINLGIVLGSLNGLSFDEHPTSSDTYWRYVFLFPLILTATRVIILYLFFNHETPFYYLLKGDTSSCRKFIENMYLPNFVDEVEGEI